MTEPTDRPAADAGEAVEIRLDLPSRLELLAIFDKVVDGVADQLSFDSDEKDAIAISVIEAVTNSIQHGHLHDPGRIVQIVFRLHPGELEVFVHDDGRGFDLDLIQDATAPENLLRERGRGIFIMRSMMDEVDYRFGDRGTTCRLVKRRRTTDMPEPEDNPADSLDELY